MMFMTRVRLYASTCNAISAATRGSVFIRKWVAPIRALIVPKGCSTVSRRRRIFSGCSSSRRCTASRICSYSQRVIRRSLPVVQLFLMAQLLASVGRVAVQDQSIFLCCEGVGEPFTGRTYVNVLCHEVAEVLLAEASFRL